MTVNNETENEDLITVIIQTFDYAIIFFRECHQSYILNKNFPRNRDLESIKMRDEVRKKEGKMNLYLEAPLLKLKEVPKNVESDHDDQTYKDMEKQDSIDESIKENEGENSISVKNTKDFKIHDNESSNYDVDEKIEVEHVKVYVAKFIIQFRLIEAYHQ